MSKGGIGQNILREMKEDFHEEIPVPKIKELLNEVKTKMSKEEKHNMAACMLSILDSLKLYDNGSLELGDETLSEMMFRKMKGYNIDLNKELDFTHLKPVTKPKQR